MFKFKIIVFEFNLTQFLKILDNIYWWKCLNANIKNAISFIESRIKKYEKYTDLIGLKSNTKKLRKSIKHELILNDVANTY